MLPEYFICYNFSVFEFSVESFAFIDHFLAFMFQKVRGKNILGVYLGICFSATDFSL